MTAVLQQDRPAPLMPLPFRVLRNGGVPYIECSINGLTASFYQGSAEYMAVTKVMELFRALERSVGGIEKERDAAKEEVGKLKDEAHRKDCKITEYERRLTRGKNPKEG